MAGPHRVTVRLDRVWSTLYWLFSVGTPQVADQARVRRAGEWTCEHCTYINRDTDIECRICSHAPWKTKLIGVRLAVTQKQATGEVLGQPEDHSKSKWKCSICTVINDWANTQCDTCETPWIADRRRGSPNNSESATTHQPHLVAEFPPADFGRAPSPGKIMGTMNQSTQTEGLDAGNPAQKMFGRICQLVKTRASGKTPASSIEGSPRTQTPEPSWSQLDNAMARWACSRCAFQNNMDTIYCEKCGFEDKSPSVRFSSCTSDSLKVTLGNRWCLHTGPPARMQTL